MISLDQLSENLAHVRGRIEAACERSGRDPAQVTLLPVTKTHSPELITALIELGLDAVGENRVQELRDKHRWFAAQGAAQPRWHFIGNLQRNKVKTVLASETILFHALDSAPLAEEIEKVCERRGTSLDCLAEVNVSGEASKHGLTPENAVGQLRPILDNADNLRLHGFMTMAPLESDPEATRPVFRHLRELRDRLQLALEHPLPILSMGMTNDYEVAIEEGATIVRIGTALFGPRGR